MRTASVLRAMSALIMEADLRNVGQLQRECTALHPRRLNFILAAVRTWNLTGTVTETLFMRCRNLAVKDKAMERSSWVGNSCSAGQEVRRLLRTPSFTNLFARARHRCLSWAVCVWYTPSNPASLTSMLTWVMHVGFRVVVREIPFRVPWFSPVCIIPPWLSILGYYPGDVEWEESVLDLVGKPEGKTTYLPACCLGT
jgi:hypothetical protein